MSLSIQFSTMFAMVLTGVWIGAGFDTFNRFLQRSKRKRWFVFCNDILFWVVQALIVFFVLFTVNEGELRFYIFAALLCGYAAYQSLMKQLYTNVLERMISLGRRIISILITLFTVLVARPVQWLTQAAVAISLFFLHFVGAVLLFLLKVIVTPLNWSKVLLWRLVPVKIKKFIHTKAGNANKIKNRLKIILGKFRR
ncbi:spore cortex biosynthesis protein YabQ [Bacillus marinisedimentorum]|uniref:spore cortex biosynthesis protein YabQ n=1 Tax=Bacillus marinisedimentorum TaxID=1821260 RepID=UPI000872DC62|nr:spore cortex biosynthesis protein YabQ [Bacillus marinisedimentorum]